MVVLLVLVLLVEVVVGRENYQEKIPGVIVGMREILGLQCVVGVRMRATHTHTPLFLWFLFFRIPANQLIIIKFEGKKSCNNNNDDIKTESTQSRPLRGCIRTRTIQGLLTRTVLVRVANPNRADYGHKFS